VPNQSVAALCLTGPRRAGCCCVQNLFSFSVSRRQSNRRHPASVREPSASTFIAAMNSCESHVSRHCQGAQSAGRQPAGTAAGAVHARSNTGADRQMRCACTSIRSGLISRVTTSATLPAGSAAAAISTSGWAVIDGAVVARPRGRDRIRNITYWYYIPPNRVEQMKCVLDVHIGDVSSAGCQLTVGVYIKRGGY
jgi:hypothetical protein